MDVLESAKRADFSFFIFLFKASQKKSLRVHFVMLFLDSSNCVDDWI